MTKIIINLGERERNAIKIEASKRGITMKDLLLGIFFNYLRHDEIARTRIVDDIIEKLEKNKNNPHIN